MRDDLERQIDQLRTTVISMAEKADEMLGGALRALEDSDANAAELVVASDELLDNAYEQVQQGVLAVIALHGPVGGDLRLLTSLIHVSLHVERMGDYAVNVARTAIRSAGFPSDAALLEQLTEMGELGREVGRTAVRAFVHKDVDLAHDVSRLDADVDRLNLGIFHRLVLLAAEDDSRLEWAASMIQLTRQLERYADHGVDVAEQAIFVATGKTVELSRTEAD